MILRQRATVKRSFTIPRIGTHRPPSKKAGLAGWQEEWSQNSAISPDPEAPDRTIGELVFVVSGRMNAENIGELESLLNSETAGPRIALDLNDLTSSIGSR